MTNTEAVRAAFSQMQRQAENLGAGYTIEPRVSPDGEHITLIIRSPKDSAKAVYPDVMFHDDWYGKEINIASDGLFIDRVFFCQIVDGQMTLGAQLCVNIVAALIGTHACSPPLRVRCD